MTDRDVDDVLEELREIVDHQESLQSMDPREAFDLWMDSQSSKAESTLQSYRYRVTPFLSWLEKNDIHDLSEVQTHHIKEFEVEQRSRDKQRNTLNNQFGTLKIFLSFCVDLDAVSKDVVSAIDIPDLDKDDRVNTEKLISNRAEKILDKLDTFRYASRRHVLFLLLWRTTARIGTIHALDVDDVFLTDEDRHRLREDLEREGYTAEVVDEILSKVELPMVYPQHRPELGTPLKNGDGGVRVINLAEWVGDVLEDYLKVTRSDVVDENGRRPLITSSKGDGRLSRSAIRNWIYLLTQPCEFGGPCPHDRDPEECVAREHGHGSKCPSAKSPHKIRTGSITWHRDKGWPADELAQRSNTSKELIDSVYDQPEDLVRGSLRREFIDSLDDSSDKQ